jgi:hypothetical protein
MSTRNIPVNKGRPMDMAENGTAVCAEFLDSMRSLKSHNPILLQGLLRG